MTAPRSLTDEQAIAAAGAARARSLPPAAEGSLRRCAQLMSAALQQENSGTDERTDAA
jgi:hypothetical protein